MSLSGPSHLAEHFKTLMQDHHDKAMQEYLIKVPLKRRPLSNLAEVTHTRLYKGISWTLPTLMSPLLQTTEGPEKSSSDGTPRHVLASCT